ncbi:344R [Invertebrate iridescent virus 6]|uniref:344R n=1 Tax=Invertebrate iridescent virus 6 TaxID=176652 RepID=Q91FI0_IIV6|nr:344R [Invertebrate iridescent virus 6]AAK82205.1 344R [Invertebrate iridescent virus 6]QMS79666.1 hypothetical protein IIV6-T1_337 [Invertebrate iridescent virus 6]
MTEAETPVKGSISLNLAAFKNVSKLSSKDALDKGLSSFLIVYLVMGSIVPEYVILSTKSFI